MNMLAACAQGKGNGIFDCSENEVLSGNIWENFGRDESRVALKEALFTVLSLTTFPIGTQLTRTHISVDLISLYRTSIQYL
jgi:hypothetical protein